MLFSKRTYKIAVYVPESHLETVKEAMFAAGAGRIGNYEACAWQVLGEGQFRPLSGSRPTIGKRDTLQRVAEYKVEMICPANRVALVTAALKNAHPYEEPAFDVWRLNL